MPASVIDGKAIALEIQGEVAEQIKSRVAAGLRPPGLATILVGDDGASRIYVRNKRRACDAAGIRSFDHDLPGNTPQQALLELIDELNTDDDVDGILVQLPLPGHIEETLVIERITPTKDVDGFHTLNVGRLNSGQDAMVPCTPVGCLLMLKEVVGDRTGMQAIVVGRSNIVGKPMAALLLKEHCTVTIAHSRTRDLAGECRRADIVIAAVGRARMVKGAWIKPGATVIDVGINRIDDASRKSGTRLVGDVDFDETVKVAGAITPVPGGVGPMTIACLLQNTLTAACRQTGVPEPE